jgi:hypothetical protein
VREWGVPVRDASFYDKVVGVLKVVISAIFPFSYLNFTNGGMSTSRGGVTDEAGF